MRVAAGVEFDGSLFHGWQKQPGLQTVQLRVEEALSKVADSPIQVICAGRTDTGVHATGQVIHFDTSTDRTMRSWIFGANHSLPKSISLNWAKIVSEEFNARFSAIARNYHYFIYNNPVRPALFRSNTTWHYRELDINLMQTAANYLIGEHDFTSFRALECQARSPIRKIFHLNVNRYGDLIRLDVKANAFLHHMIRNIAGVLISIGSGSKPTAWAKEVLDARSRSLAGVTAPPYGLYLSQVFYPEQFQIPLARIAPFFIPNG